MMKNIKTRKALLLAVVLGIVSFAVYGVYNIAHALAATGTVAASGDAPAAINTLVPAGTNPDGSVCSPFGCAACGGCSAPLYQPAADTVINISMNE